MCTVTFLPLSKAEFILTSNRDEIHLRKPATFPASSVVNGSEIWYPKDGQAGGTWIAHGTSGITACLLNGAFDTYQRKNSYRHSRGLIPLMIHEYDSIHLFAGQVDLTNIEPFTLVMIQQSDDMYLSELRWDGEKRYIRSLSPDSPHIWSSATLYSQEVRNNREQWFNDWVQENEFSLDGIREFHHFGGNGNQANDLLMMRENGMSTVSITSILKTEDVSSMVYKDVHLARTESIEIA